MGPDRSDRDPLQHRHPALIAGTTYLDVDPLLRIIQPQVNELSARLDETIHYGRLQGTEIVYLATHESAQYVRPYSRVGRRLPAYATAMGKSILAARLAEGGPAAVAPHLPVRVLAPLTPRTITESAALLAELEATTIRGYAIDDEENVPGLRCFAQSYVSSPWSSRPPAPTLQLRRDQLLGSAGASKRPRGGDCRRDPAHRRHHRTDGSAEQLTPSARCMPIPIPF